jgi:hypothetical protein
VACAVVVGYQRGMPRAWCWVALAVLSASAAPAQAFAGVPTRLVYARAPSARECPDEPALASAVAARLGYDPFSPWGDQTILATISRVNGGLIGHAQLIDHDGIAQGWSVLPTTSQLSGGGAMETSLLAAALVPCFELVRHWRLCAIGSLGSLAASGREVDVPRSQRVLHATAGARARLVWPLGERFEPS